MTGVPTCDRPISGYNSFDGGMTVHEDMLVNPEDRKALTGFFRAVAKGAVFSVENPAAAQRIHFDLFPASIPKGKDFEQAVKDAARDYKANLDLMIPQGAPGYFGLQTREKWETVAYELMQLSRDTLPDVGEFYSADLIAQATDFNHEAIRQQPRGFELYSEMQAERIPPSPRYGPAFRPNPTPPHPTP